MMQMNIGGWAAAIGLGVAAVTAFIPLGLSPDMIKIILGITGLIVGAINVTGKETNMFLVLTIGLALGLGAVSETFSFVPMIAKILTNVSIMTWGAFLAIAAMKLPDIILRK